MTRFLTVAALIFAGSGALSAGGPTPSNPDATVYIVNLSDGATTSSPVKVVFGVSGMGIAPAGVEWDNTGHHHLLVNRAAFGADDPAELSDPIPGDENHLHFGGGQTETILDLPPGDHTLQLVFGDHFHVPHADPVMSDVITITVE